MKLLVLLVAAERVCDAETGYEHSSYRNNMTVGKCIVPCYIVPTFRDAYPSRVSIFGTLYHKSKARYPEASIIW